MAAPRTGNAIFSTDLGRYPVRGISDLPPRIILRSDPEEDVDVMIAELTEKYPAECKLIKPNTINLHEYFDAYDQQIHGALFLQFVLDEICRRNYKRRHAVLDYASDWVRLNPMAFEHMWGYGLEAFTADDLTAFGEDFLEEALEELRVRRIKHDDARQSGSLLPRSLVADLDPVGLAAAQGRIPNVEHLQQITRPSPVLPSQEQPMYFSGQRNSSAPFLLDMSSTRSPSHASTALTTQSMPQVDLSHSQIHPSMQRSDLTVYGSLEPIMRSGPLYHSDPVDNSSGFSRPGYSERQPAISNTATMGEPLPYPQSLGGPRTFHFPSRKPRTPMYAKGPIYIGPSNDARILGHQTAEQYRGYKGRIPFEESQMSQHYPYPYPRHYPPPHQLHSPTYPPGLSLQGSRNSTLGRSNLATGMVPPETDNSAASATTKPTNQSLDSMADQANSSRFQGGFHDAQGASTTQRRDEDFDDAEATGHHARPDTASTHHSQHADNRTSLANPVPHRLSTAPSRPYEGTASTRYSTEFQPGHGSRPRMTDDHEHIPPNRKVWIGGLLPDSDGRLLQQMLDPWKPSDVGPILCSTKAGGNKGYGGFAFAEYAALSSVSVQLIDHL